MQAGRRAVRAGAAKRTVHARTPRRRRMSFVVWTRARVGFVWIECGDQVDKGRWGNRRGDSDGRAGGRGEARSGHTSDRSPVSALTKRVLCTERRAVEGAKVRRGEEIKGSEGKRRRRGFEKAQRAGERSRSTRPRRSVHAEQAPLACVCACGSRCERATVRTPTRAARDRLASRGTNGPSDHASALFLFSSRRETCNFPYCNIRTDTHTSRHALNCGTSV